MSQAQITALSGDRLHLHHGPIDIIVKADGPARDTALTRVAQRFETVLQDLVAELPALRQSKQDAPFRDPIARAMQAAVQPFSPVFVTPMAAVAGAVADAICAEMAMLPGITKAYANNGGDVAFHLIKGSAMTAIIAATGAEVTLPFDSPVRGLATSGWRGRSHSLGIADAVTVLAKTAARADAAATLIANAVDLPAHPGITRCPAWDISPDSDLGTRLVTTNVGHITPAERGAALAKGVARATTYRSQGFIEAAYLVLQSESRVVPDPC